MELIWKRDKLFYDKFYWNNINVWWTVPDSTLQEARKIFDKNEFFLDLWCWQWRNTFYMASEWFKVEAVDFSQEALTQIENQALLLWISGIKTRC